MNCPDPTLLRAYAEPEGLAGLVDDVPAFEQHVASCARCRRIIDDARTEEKLLRGVELPRPRGTPRALEKTLARLEAHGDRGAGGLPRVLFVVIAALGAAGVLLVFSTGTPPPSPDPVAVPVPAPAPSPVPAPAPVRAPAPAPAPVPAPDPDAVPAPDPVPVPAPDPVPVPVPTPTPVPVPTPTPTPTELRVLAFARSGTLSGAKKDAPLPESAVITVGSTLAEIETVGSATLVFAPRSTFTVAPGEKGEAVVTLTAGKLLARSHGAPYAVATRDGLVKPLGTVFAVSLDPTGTRVTTLEGEVELESSTKDALSARVRPGFEGRLVKGKKTDLPAPTATDKAVEWLPKDKRPKPVAPPRIVLDLAYDEATGKFPKLGGRSELDKDGRIRGSAQFVGPKLVPLDPDEWFEAVLRVDRAAKVTLMVWDDDIKENFAVELPVEPGRFRTVAAPLRDFYDKAKKGRAIRAGDATHEVNVYAVGRDGARVELVVERVRFFR